MRLYEVREGLFTSARPKTVADRVRLEARGINTIVTLCYKYPEEEAFPQPVLHWIASIPDGKRVGPALSVAQSIKSLIPGGRVLLHCNAGQNRSPFVAALLIHELDGWTGERIFEHLRAVRPNCLTNPAFQAYVRGLS